MPRERITIITYYFSIFMKLETINVFISSYIQGFKSNIYKYIILYSYMKSISWIIGKPILPLPSYHILGMTF